jgi:hypothetical protein
MMNAQFLKDVPENELTESLCHIIFYSHISDEDWEYYMENIRPGEHMESPKYGILITRDMYGTLHFPIF